MTNWDALYNDRKYAALSYDQQLEVRSHFLQRDLMQDENFTRLDPQAQKYVYNQLIAQTKPVFENATNENVEYLKLGQGIQEGDEQAVKKSILRLGTDAFQSQMSFLKFFGDLADGSSTLFTGRGHETALQAQKRIITQDMKKGQAYIEYLLNQDAGNAKYTAISKVVGNITGFAVDFGAWALTTKGIGKAFSAGASATKAGKMLGIGEKAVMGGTKALTAKGLRMSFTQRAATSAIRDAKAGVIGVLRDNILGHLDEEYARDPGFFNTVWQNSKTFGEYFFADMMMFGAWEALGVVGGAAKGVFGGKYGTKYAKEALSEADFQKAYKLITASGSLDDATIRTLPKAAQEKLLRSRSAYALAQNVENLDPTSPEFMRLFARGNGFDIIPEGNKWKVFDLTDELSVKTFNKYDDAVKKLYHSIDSRFQFDVRDNELVKGVMGAADDIKVRERISASTKGLQIEADGVQQMMKPKVDGTLNKNNVKYVGQEVLKRSGVDVSEYLNKTVKAVDNYYDLPTRITDDTIFVPKKIITPDDEVKFMQTFFDDIDDIAKGAGREPGVGKALRQEIFTNRLSMGYSPSWIKFAADKYAGAVVEPSGKEFLLKAGGEVLSKGSLDDIGEYLFTKHLFTDDTVDAIGHTQSFLAKNKGVSLKVKADGTLMASTKTGSKTQYREAFNDLTEVFAKHPDWKPKLPQSSLPDIVITDNTLKRFSIENGIAAGPTLQTVQFMDKFADYSDLKKLVPFESPAGTKLSFNKVSRRFIAELDELGVKRSFKTADAAKKFLKEGAENFDNVRINATFKGARLVPYKGKYLIYQAGASNPHVAQSLAEAKTVIKGLEMPEYVAKELTGISPGFAEGLEMEFRDMLPENAFQETSERITERIRKLGEEGRVKTRTKLYSKVAPTDVIIKRLSNETGEQGFYTAWREYEKAAQITRGQMSTFKRVFRSATGRLTKEQDVRLGKLIASGVERADYERVYKEMFNEAISAQELTAISRARQIYGNTPEEGLFKLFGIDNWKFVENYLPRIRAELEKGTINLSTNAKEALSEIMGVKTLPKEIAFFAENLRTDDVLHFAAMDSFTDIMETYARLGYRKLMLNEPYQNALNFLKTSKADEWAKQRFNLYLELERGMFTTQMQQDLNEGTRKLIHTMMDGLKKQGFIKNDIVEKGVYNDMITMAQSWTIGATMSYRAWLPIRNSFQPFTTLAPRIGYDNVVEGMKRAAQNGEEIVKRLKASGRIPDKNPLMDMMGTTKLTGFIGQFNNRGMQWYTNSDAWTRAVVDQSVESMMDNAAKRFISGMIDEKAFMKLSKLNVMDVNVQNEVLGYLKKGDLRIAKDTFADHLTTETMFPYKQSSNPEVFRGMMGRIFGGFGHYPVYYTTNIIRGFANTSAAGKAAFAARTVGGSLALYHGFDKLLGIDAKNFLFYTPMSFAGGPYYQLLNESLQSTQTGYEGDLARAKLPVTLKSLFVPGNILYRNMQKASEALTQGNYHDFFIYGLSAPKSENF